MDERAKVRVSKVDRFDSDGVIISFDDGITALYSVTMLRQMLPQARLLEDDPELDFE